MSSARCRRSRRPPARNATCVGQRSSPSKMCVACTPEDSNCQHQGTPRASASAPARQRCAWPVRQKTATVSTKERHVRRPALQPIKDVRGLYARRQQLSGPRNATCVGQRSSPSKMCVACTPANHHRQHFLGRGLQARQAHGQRPCTLRGGPGCQGCARAHPASRPQI